MNDKPASVLTNPKGYKQWPELTDAEKCEAWWRACEERDRLRAALEEIKNWGDASMDGEPCTWCTNHPAACAIKIAREALSGEPPSPSEPSVTRLLVPGSRMARLSDIADSLVREMRRQGMETLQAVFDGVKVRVEPWQDPPEKSTGKVLCEHGNGPLCPICIPPRTNGGPAVEGTKDL